MRLAVLAMVHNVGDDAYALHARFDRRIVEDDNATIPGTDRPDLRFVQRATIEITRTALVPYLIQTFTHPSGETRTRCSAPTTSS